jgi:hypothetical protein
LDRTLILALAAGVVIVPILIGFWKGHLPKEIFGSWAIPLAATTFLLGIGVQFIETYFGAAAKLAASLAFASAWGFAGVYIGFVQPKRNPELPEQIREAMKTVGVLFLGFSLLWAGLSF